jgi:hypothetical protein
MSILVAVRNGYTQNGVLTSDGRMEMAALAEVLRPYLEGRRVFTFTSAYSAPAESAEILTKALGLEVPEPTAFLGDGSREFSKLLAQVRAKFKKADVVIVVGHASNFFGNSPRFLSYYAQHVLKVSYEEAVLEFGHAVLMDSESPGEVVLLP